MKLILQIALGVSLGIVLGGSLLFLYTSAFTEQINTALKQSVAQNTVAPRSPQPVNDLLASNTPATPSFIKPEITQATAQPSNPAAPVAEPIVEINTAGKKLSAAAIAEKDDRTQMEMAFKRNYTKPKKCQSPNEDHDLLVACGNEYIRARDKFEILWRQGAFNTHH